MGILTLQQRARQLGRIRTGRVVKSGNKSRPEKLDTLRFTSDSRPLIERIAELYGGTVEAWTPQGGGAQQWEVVSKTSRVPVLVPPQEPVTQHFELWSGGGCERRCDGVTEKLTGQPCLCDPDPEQRDCKPTTRLNVVLRDVEGIGVWRLDSHGFYAATELPALAEFLSQARGYIEAHLVLEQRTVKRGKQTRHFMVPGLEIGITPAQLLAGAGQIAAPAIESGGNYAANALPAADVVVAQDPESFHRAVAAVTDIEQLRGVWADARAANVLTDELLAALHERARQLTPHAHDPVLTAGDDVDALWGQIQRTVPESWKSDQVEDHFASVTGVAVEQAGADSMRTYLAYLADTA